ncbi:class I SAM-dependent methyltransferase [Ralstonia sp. SET104]|uniref:class I SAM-dependent methyltransferase n=1 Tax=Ralstonia sp. SET104 TaxID=2448774 RepID=UPI000F56D1C1|nr:class I SAM-dependent methyltransferase [Ralstonia sp. SET104]GCB06402.1 hypothetical protein PSUB009319_40330 [Ralstonia sp. SET104]
MSTLRQLYQKHRGKVSDKWDAYLSGYDAQFNPYRQQEIRLLEIGIQNGGSLEIWREYFPEAKKLIGCDINPECAKLHYDDPRITVVVGDANSDECERRILTHSDAFDIIIDDGSHTSTDIIRSFARYFSHLKHGGLYVVEDLHCSYWREYEGGLPHPYSSMSFLQRLTDIVNYEHWGIDKTRSEHLSRFANRYATVFNEQLLAEIHSVEFQNSLCLIRKASPEHNTLGPRVVAGDLETVTEGIRQLHATPLPCPPQQESGSLVGPASSREEQERTAPLESMFAATSPETRTLANRDLKIQLFIDSGLGYSESESITFPLHATLGIEHRKFDLTGKDKIQALRLDPINDSAILSINKVLLSTSLGEFDLLPHTITNCDAKIENVLFFENKDPIIYFDNLTSDLLSAATELIVEIEFLMVGQEARSASRQQTVAEKLKHNELLCSTMWQLSFALHKLRDSRVEQRRALQIIAESHEAAAKEAADTHAHQKAIYKQSLQLLTEQHASTLVEAKQREASLRNEHETLVRALQDAHALAINGLSEQNAHQQQHLESLIGQHASTLREAKERETSLKSEQEKLIFTLREEHASAINALETLNAHQNAAYEQQLKSLTTQLASALVEIKEREAALKSEQEKLVCALREEHTSAINALEGLNMKQHTAYEQRFLTITKEQVSDRARAMEREASLIEEQDNLNTTLRNEHAIAIEVKSRKITELESLLIKIRGCRGYKWFAWLNRAKLSNEL